MQTVGSSAKDALNQLVNQAQGQGGIFAQDPSARALSEASNLGGDLITTLQGMGQGNMFDDKIRQLQKTGELKGYSPEIRQSINMLRHSQADMANDARAMNGLRLNPVGGGGASSSGGQSIMAGDELSLIAQLLGKYRGTQDFNQNRTGFGDSGLSQMHLSEGNAMINALKPIYDEMLKQKHMESQLLENKLRSDSAPQKAPRMSAGNSSSMSWEDMRRADKEKKDMMRMSKKINSTNQNSEYAPIRDEAINAALRYMRINAPHLISSLGR